MRFSWESCPVHDWAIYNIQSTQESLTECLFLVLLYPHPWTQCSGCWMCRQCRTWSNRPRLSPSLQCLKGGWEPGDICSILAVAHSKLIYHCPVTFRGIKEHTLGLIRSTCMTVAWYICETWSALFSWSFPPSFKTALEKTLIVLQKLLRLSPYMTAFLIFTLQDLLDVTNKWFYHRWFSLLFINLQVCHHNNNYYGCVSYCQYWCWCSVHSP